MKRSSCLSAVLVGLSLTTTSIVLAAPQGSDGSETDGKTKPTLVAQATPSAKPGTRQVQPTEPAPSGGTPAPSEPEPAPAAPEAAPSAAPGAESAPAPAITLGGSTTPGTDAPSTAPEEPKKKPPMRRWAGTQVASYTSMSTATVFQGQQQDYNPTVDTSLWLLPRFNISESFQLRGLLVFNYEFTNSDSTVTRNEPRFSDTLLSLFYKKIPVIPGVGIKPAVAATLGLPTSPESRARTLIANPGVSLQLVKGFEHVLGGEIDIISSVGYSHPIYNYTTPGTTFPYAPSCFGDTGCGSQLSGTMNASDTMLYMLILTGEWGKWSPAVMYRGTSQWTYHPKETTATLPSGTVVDPTAPNGFDRTNVRQASYFSFWLDYNANSWFTTEVGYWLSRPSLDEDGQRGNPFFNRYQDMRVYLGFNFNIDNLMKTLEGGETEAGIVRAKNNKTPMWNF